MIYLLLFGGFILAVSIFTFLDLLRVWHATSFFPFMKYARSAYFISFATRLLLMSAIYLILYYAPTAVLLAIGVQFELTGPSTVLIYGISVPLIYLVLLERIIWNGFVAKVSVKEEFKEFQQNINNSVSLHGQMRLISRLLDKKSTDEAINCFSETFVGTGHLSTDDFSSIVKKSKEYENQFGENTGIHYLLNHIRKFNVDNKAILNALMRCSS